jgi:hypothetical protein
VVESFSLLVKDGRLVSVLGASSGPSLRPCFRPIGLGRRAFLERWDGGGE